MSPQAAFAVDTVLSKSPGSSPRSPLLDDAQQHGPSPYAGDTSSNSKAPVSRPGGRWYEFDEHRSIASSMSSSSGYHVVHQFIGANEAARRVAKCLRKRQHHVVGRILRRLINRSVSLDRETLESILIAADNVFFDGKLGKRVEWKWSGDDERQYDPRYEHELLGTTAVRRANSHHEPREVETLIILSSPLLRNRRYTPDLLLSTFIHELVHCYLFICCGEEACKDGGHCPEFRAIMKTINDWAGNPRLHLCSMKAYLDDFLIKPIDRHSNKSRHDLSYQLLQATPPPYVERNDYSCGHGNGDDQNPIYLMDTFSDVVPPGPGLSSLSSAYVNTLDCPQADA